MRAFLDVIVGGRVVVDGGDLTSAQGGRWGRPCDDRTVRGRDTGQTYS